LTRSEPTSRKVIIGAMDLCRACGLCCDGSLFGRVMFDRGEIIAPKKRLRLIADGRGFEQPCSALDESSRACAIYDERPAACRRFVCRLLDRHEREHVPLETSLAIVKRTRELLRDVDADALGEDERGELAALVERHFARVTA